VKADKILNAPCFSCSCECEDFEGNIYPDHVHHADYGDPSYGSENVTDESVLTAYFENDFEHECESLQSLKSNRR